MTNKYIRRLPSYSQIILFISSRRRQRDEKSTNTEATEVMNGGAANGGGTAATNPNDPNSWLPRYLFGMVRHYHDDFYVSRSFDPRLIVQLMAEGFLPIATRGYLLPKLHVERCVLQLNPTSNLHISRSTRKKCKRYLMSVNECFDRVVAGCHRQHGINWLYPPIVEAFRQIHERTKEANGGGVNAMIMNSETNQPQDVTPVRLYSVEIWNAQTGALAGGELGYSVGGIYSSLTGFSDEDAAGSCQLVTLGKLLTRCGFEYWDLGMDLEYKRRLGADMVQRADWVNRVKRSRIENKGVTLQISGGDRRNAKELVDWERPIAAAAAEATTTKSDNDAMRNDSADGGGNLPPPPPSSSADNEGGNPKRSRKRSHDEEEGMNGNASSS